MKLIKRAALAVCLAGVFSLAGCGSDGDDDNDASQDLHVASPQWEDQIIYFVMTDRFNDGDSSNNDQGAGEYDPTSNAKYSGGDLKGIQDKIDYIKGLGATAVWITPPVANQWWDARENYGGYHGYWARDFKAVDAHYGTLADYQNLSRALHRQGMYLVQDIVVNHMANCFSWNGTYDPANPATNAVLNTNAKPDCGPTQAPFNQWNVTDPAHRAANIFHWTPPINNYQDVNQERNYALADLDDLNTENETVVAALKDSYAYWIKTVGVDAFRIDTVFYTPPAFLKRFMHDSDGILSAAKSTGRNNFLAFGEGFASDRAFDDTQARKIEGYMRDAAGLNENNVLPSMINFPMYATAGDVFARGHAPTELGYRLNSFMTLHKSPWTMTNFIDNHDVNRYLNGGSDAAMRQSLMYMMTIPGVPVIYYGTEQGFKEQRGSMFKAGFGSGGKDNFDTASSLYQYTKSITQVRKDHAVFRRGTPTVLKQNETGPGVFAYKMSLTGEKSAFVIFNTADQDVLLDNLDTGLAAGTKLKLLKGLGMGDADAVVGAGGKLTLKLPARAGLVYQATDEVTTVPGSGATIELTQPSGVQSNDFTVSGKLNGSSATTLKVVVDGDLQNAQNVTVGGDGSWSTTVSIAGMVDPQLTHTVVAYLESANVASNTGTFTVDRPFTEVASHTDPALDDTGPAGYAYHYPSDSSWGNNHQGDLRKVTLYASGPVLKIGLTMPSITTVWAPQNGFDHVAFTIFIDVPGKTGKTLMPQQNASVPAGMDWDYKIRVHGWSNALFSSEGADKDKDGAAVSPASTIQVDQADKTVYLTVSHKSLGNLTTLNGVKVYATTWDYDGGYRGLSPTTQQWQFWGGNGTTDPLILDDTPVITIQ